MNCFKYSNAFFCSPDTSVSHWITSIINCVVIFFIYHFPENIQKVILNVILTMAKIRHKQVHHHFLYSGQKQLTTMNPHISLEKSCMMYCLVYIHQEFVKTKHINWHLLNIYPINSKKNKIDLLQRNKTH